MCLISCIPTTRTLGRQCADKRAGCYSELKKKLVRFAVVHSEMVWHRIEKSADVTGNPKAGRNTKGDSALNLTYIKHPPTSGHSRTALILFVSSGFNIFHLVTAHGQQVFHPQKNEVK